MIPVTSSGFPPGMVIWPSGTTPRFHEFYDRLDALEVPAGTARLRISGPDIDANRDRAVREFLRYPQLRWAFFLDDDQEFEADALIMMLGKLYDKGDFIGRGPRPTSGDVAGTIVNYATGADAIASFYVHKYPPFTPVLFRAFDVRDPDPKWHLEARIGWAELAEAAKGDGMLRDVLCAGAGALLVHRRALDTLAPGPWFLPHHDTTGRRRWGGDVGFGILMRSKGMRIDCWVGRPFGHTIACTLTPRWNAAESRWEILFKMVDDEFALPVEMFEGGRWTTS